ncbi:branched-chain amino acid transport system II carrier protein [Streptococcus gallolyticus]|uniref:branched-chain amino acid transport system II carrier protein n=1 Tax=Streptococcus hepaticus TaxID=3349163 RepID=UPI001C948C89|nr:branched-chain amino acid transport system II carrier protein [Streptococcus gallolyticus]MBY5040903.1 branched-chain amino acid transport system II carrier protein [Streptococcus gallolyticus]
MKYKTSFTAYITIGLMLFALFFGAGNLIFPAYLGIYAGSNVWLAVLGFCLTAVTLPLMGVAAIAYTGTEDAESISRPVSKLYALCFSVALYLSIGPFFAIPRTGATSYSIGIEPIFGSSMAVKVIYALIFFGISYWLAIRPSKMADRIGKYLTPTLLFVLAVLVVASFLNPAGNMGAAHNASAATSDAFADLPLIAGLIQGYGTMDALASLAFSIVVINSAKVFGAKSNQEIAGITLKSGIVASLLLALVYIFVARIGATSQSLFDFTAGNFQLKGQVIDGGHVLSQASHFYLGAIGRAVLGVVIFLACITTATGLITACAEYFHKLVPKVSHVVWATIFTAIAATFYFGGLSEIIKWSLPVLFLLYPLTVAIILLAIGGKWFQQDPVVYRWTIAWTFLAGLYDALNTLAGMTGLFKMPGTIAHFFEKVVPLGAYSLGWVSFAVVGFVIGLLVHTLKKK